MNVVIKKEELQRKLADIQSISEKKTTMPILNNFILDVDTKSTIYATDLEVALKQEIEILSFESPGRFCISTRKLYEISREVNDDIILYSDTDSLEREVCLHTSDIEEFRWLKIKSGKSSFKVACLDPDEYPLWPTIEQKDTITIKAGILLEMIDKTIYCTGDNDARYELNGLLMHIKPSENRIFIVGTDGHRLAAMYKDVELGVLGAPPYVLGSQVGCEGAPPCVPTHQGGAPPHPTVKEDIKIILPKKAMVELKKFLSVLNDEDITFDITSNYVCFYLKGRQFLTKLIEGLYPDYENVIPQANNKTVVLQKDDFIKTLRRVSLISKEKGHLVKFTINESTLDFYANDPEVGEASDTIAAQLDGEPIALGFNSKFVIESVSVMDGERFKIVLLELLSPTLFMEYDNDNYKCVIMPVRL